MRNLLEVDGVRSQSQVGGGMQDAKQGKGMREGQMFPGADNLFVVYCSGNHLKKERGQTMPENNGFGIPLLRRGRGGSLSEVRAPLPTATRNPFPRTETCVHSPGWRSSSI